MLIITPVLAFSQDYQVYKGDTINRKDSRGLKQGLWRKYYRTDTLFSETYFFNDKPTGISSTWYETGKLKARVVFNKNNSGKGTGYFETGKIMAEGLYIGKQKDSIWIYYHEHTDTISAIEHYKKGVRTGTWKTFYESGKLAHEIGYSNGKKEGLVKQFNDDGKLIFEIIYKGGVEEGMSTLYYRDGKVRERGLYHKGEREGKWHIMDEQGALKEEIIYKNGIQISPKPKEAE